MPTNEHKFKIKILTLILSILLLVLSPIMTINTLGYNGDGRGSLTAGVGHEGASRKNNAFMMYFAYKDSGIAATPAMVVYWYDALPNPVDYNFVTKIRVSESIDAFDRRAVFYTHDSSAPPPVDSVQVGDGYQWVLQGYRVREYLLGVDETLNKNCNLEKDGLDVTKTPRYIAYAKILCGKTEQFTGYKGVNGVEFWEAMLDNWQDFSLVMQPVAWLHPYGTGTDDGLATADGWAQWLTDNGDSWYSHTFITGALYNCMVLEYEQWGLAVPSNPKGQHDANYNDMHGQGYAVHIIDLEGGPSNQTTCDEPKRPNPHKPKDESKDKPYKIVKCYREKGADGKYIDNGTFVKKDSSANIKIEDEYDGPGSYKLIEWRTSKIYKEPELLKSTEWEDYWKDPALTVRGEKKPMKIALDKDPYKGETTLYLLLEKVYDGTQTTCDEPKIPNPHNPPNESTGNYKIVKCYRTYDEGTNAYTNDGTKIKDNSSPNIKIEDEYKEGEESYKLIEWIVSTQYNENAKSTQWPASVPAAHTKTGDKEETVTLDKAKNETTVYLLLQKIKKTTSVDTDFTISQSTLTRKIKLSDPDKTYTGGIKILKDVTFTWKRPDHKYSCEHEHSWTDDCGNTDVTDEKGKVVGKKCGGHSHKVSCTWGKFTDEHTKVSLKNPNNKSHPNILATKDNWEVITDTGLSSHYKRYAEHSSGRSTTNDSCAHDGWDYSCVLLRGKDKLTLAEWKNTNLAPNATDHLKDASTSGFSTGNKPSGTREKKLYYDSFTFKIADDSTDLETKYSTTLNVSCHSDSGCGENKRTFYLDTSFETTANVKVETYSGSDDTVTNDKGCKTQYTSYGIFTGLTELKGFNMIRGAEVPSGKEISFYPYIQMNYDLPTFTHRTYGTATSEPLRAYVLGNIKRTMTPNDYAEISWKERPKNNPNLTISSLQWSTHASVAKFIADNGFTGYNVLPGGATLDITIENADRQRLMVTSYQCILDGTGKTQVENTIDAAAVTLTEATAKDAHTKYVNSVIAGIETLGLEQWVSNDLNGISGSNISDGSTDLWERSNSSVVEGNADLKNAGHSGQKASTEPKYYLQPDNPGTSSGAGEGDLDAAIVKDASGKEKYTTKKYTFYINTNGKMYMITGNPSANESNESAGDPINPASPSGIAKELNDRTHVIDKLYKAVEHGTGYDASGRSKTGTTWYNEAFDGITVYVQTTELTVGFFNPAKRSHVLDPRLTHILLIPLSPLSS